MGLIYSAVFDYVCTAGKGLRIQDAVLERRVYLYPEETYTFSFYVVFKRKTSIDGGVSAPLFPLKTFFNLIATNEEALKW